MSWNSRQEAVAEHAAHRAAELQAVAAAAQGLAPHIVPSTASNQAVRANQITFSILAVW